ncbi:MAG: Gfo/Idh/MocA family oxidoreductase [Opitutae bacterium]|nr:Gfo/Idh/MocA family oxidoreductase [Opitutae bacterium]
MNTPLTRRSFLKHASLAAGALAAPAFLRAQGTPARSPNNRLNVAIIGVGGMGAKAVAAMRNENIVAFCDVDEERAGMAYKMMADEYPEEWARCAGAPRFNDYRRMFDAVGNRIDAVTISTPDHMHFPAAMTAITLGKHVYCQKPLTHTVWEARELARAAREKKVVTQMGNQGHAGEGCRILKEWIEAGVLGEVREIQSWTDRPGRFWPHVKARPDHSKMIPVVPSTLNWDAWLGVASERPYDPAYLPVIWRGWWDFGTGPFGDVGCHIMDGAYWALNLGAPTAVEALASGVSEYGTALATVVTMSFPARGPLPPVKYTWSDGGLMPPLPEALEKDRSLNEEAGTLVIGSKATALCSFYYETVRLIPEAKMREAAPGLPPKTIPRVEGGPFAEWLLGCKGGPKPGSNFDYSGPFTEAVLLGNVAIRARRRIEWDAAALKVTNLPEANRFLTKEYRPGWM